MRNAIGTAPSGAATLRSLLAGLMLICGATLQAATPTVVFSLQSLTGSANNRLIVLTLASQGPGLAVATNIAFNTPIKLQPTNGTISTPLQPANYWVTIDRFMSPMFMPVPDSSLTYQAVDLIRDGLKHLAISTNYVLLSPVSGQPVSMLGIASDGTMVTNLVTSNLVASGSIDLSSLSPGSVTYLSNLWFSAAVQNYYLHTSSGAATNVTLSGTTSVGALVISNASGATATWMLGVDASGRVVTNAVPVGGGGGTDIRPLNNTGASAFTGPNTFSNAVNIAGNVNIFGTTQAWGDWGTHRINAFGDVFVDGSTITGGGHAIIFGFPIPGGDTNAVFYTPGPHGSPLSIYSGALDDLFFGGNHKAVLFLENQIFADLSQSTNMNASELRLGTVPDARQSANVTLKGNTFNGANQLVQLGLSGQMPVVDGFALLNLNGANIASSSMPLSGIANISGHRVAGNFTGSSGAVTAGQVTEAEQSLSDVTTLNASPSAHGYLRKLDGNAAHYLDGNGGLSTPAGLPPSPGVGTTVSGTAVNVGYPTLYVSPYGLTNNAGTPTAPLPMPYALTIVGGGTLVLVTNFPSSAYWDVTATNAGLTIQNWNYPNATWNTFLVVTNAAASSIFVEPGVANVTIQGLEIWGNTNQDAIKAQGVSNLTVRDCYLHNNSGNGVLAQDNNNLLIERNLVVGNGTNNVNVNHLHGVYVGGTNLVVRNNVAYDNTNGYGIQVYGNAFPSNNLNCQVYQNLVFGNSRGITLAQEVAFTNFVFNNTCVSNVNQAFQFYGRGTGTIFVSNNIIENNGNGAIASSGGTLIEDYNVVESAVSSPGTHDVAIADAGTLNGAKGLYWLTLNSPARNVAFNRPPPVDFYGYPQSSVADVGAFQYYPHNWRSYDNRTLYHSSYPDYWSVFAFVPDTLPLAQGANVTNLTVWDANAAPSGKTFYVNDETGVHLFRVLFDGTWAFKDPVTTVQTLFWNSGAVQVGTNFSVANGNDFYGRQNGITNSAGRTIAQQISDSTTASTNSPAVVYQASNLPPGASVNPMDAGRMTNVNGQSLTGLVQFVQWDCSAYMTNGSYNSNLLSWVTEGAGSGAIQGSGTFPWLLMPLSASGTNQWGTQVVMDPAWNSNAVAVSIGIISATNSPLTATSVVFSVTGDWNGNITSPVTVTNNIPLTGFAVTNIQLVLPTAGTIVPNERLKLQVQYWAVGNGKVTNTLYSDAVRMSWTNSPVQNGAVALR